MKETRYTQFLPNYYNAFKITNLHYDEQAEWCDNSEEGGKNKSGYVDLKTSVGNMEAGVYDDNYDYIGGTTYNGLKGWSIVSKDDISNFELKWELYSYVSSYKDYDYMRAEYSKSDGYVSLRMRFTDQEKFNQWARKLLNTSN